MPQVENFGLETFMFLNRNIYICLLDWFDLMYLFCFLVGLFLCSHLGKSPSQTFRKNLPSLTCIQSREISLVIGDARLELKVLLLLPICESHRKQDSQSLFLSSPMVLWNQEHQREGLPRLKSEFILNVKPILRKHFEKLFNPKISR